MAGRRFEMVIKGRARLQVIPANTESFSEAMCWLILAQGQPSLGDFRGAASQHFLWLSSSAGAACTCRRACGRSGRDRGAASQQARWLRSSVGAALTRRRACGRPGRDRGAARKRAGGVCGGRPVGRCAGGDGGHEVWAARQLRDRVQRRVRAAGRRRRACRRAAAAAGAASGCARSPNPDPPCTLSTLHCDSAYQCACAEHAHTACGLPACLAMCRGTAGALRTALSDIPLPSPTSSCGMRGILLSRHWAGCASGPWCAVRQHKQTMLTPTEVVAGAPAARPRGADRGGAG